MKMIEVCVPTSYIIYIEIYTFGVKIPIIIRIAYKYQAVPFTACIYIVHTCLLYKLFFDIMLEFVILNYTYR